MTACATERKVVVGCGRDWKDAIHNAFGYLDVEVKDNERFAGRLTFSHLGNIEIAEVAGGSEHSRRTRAHISRDNKDFFVLTLVRSGTLEITQAGRQCRLLPGSFGLLYMNSPYVWLHNNDVELIDLKIPTAQMSLRLSSPDAALAKPFVAQTGIGRVVADMLQSLAKEATEFPECQARLYSDLVLDMVAVLLDSKSPGLPLNVTAVRSALYQRALMFIDAHLDNPALNPTMIAEAVGISVRYLHRIFQETDNSVGDHLRNTRLQRCYEALKLKSIKRGIGQIAFAAGFQSQSHFTAAFKARYGTAPSAVRRHGDHFGGELMRHKKI